MTSENLTTLHWRSSKDTLAFFTRQVDEVMRLDSVLTVEATLYDLGHSGRGWVDFPQYVKLTFEQTLAGEGDDCISAATTFNRLYPELNREILKYLDTLSPDRARFWPKGFSDQLALIASEFGETIITASLLRHYDPEKYGILVLGSRVKDKDVNASSI